MEFTITALDGESLTVEAENWMAAMGRALSTLEVDPSELERVTCSVGNDGSVLVEEGRRSWTVRPPGVPDGLAGRAGVRVPPPAVVMPRSSLEREEPLTLAEHLFELSNALDPLTPAQAADRALYAILAFVRADGSCVLRGTLDDAALECVAARGPRARHFLGRGVGFGEGLVGMAFDMRGTLCVHDATGETPHVDLVEAPSLSVACVPLLDDEGGAVGVIELVNPANRAFTDADVQVVETVARTLAAALAGR